MKNAGRVLLNPTRDLVAVQRLVFEHHQDGELRAAAFDRMTQRCHGVLYIGYLYIRCQGLAVGGGSACRLAINTAALLRTHSSTVSNPHALGRSVFCKSRPDPV